MARSSSLVPRDRHGLPDMKESDFAFFLFMVSQYSEEFDRSLVREEVLHTFYEVTESAFFNGKESLESPEWTEPIPWFTHSSEGHAFAAKNLEILGRYGGLYVNGAWYSIDWATFDILEQLYVEY